MMMNPPTTPMEYTRQRPWALEEDPKKACPCCGLPVEKAASYYSVANAVSSLIQLVFFIRQFANLTSILETAMSYDPRVCDTMKPFDAPDDCEPRASKIAAELLALSVTEAILSASLCLGVIKKHVDICYAWISVSALLAFLMPLLQYNFFKVTTWWNLESKTLFGLLIIHVAGKCYGLILIIQLIKVIRSRQSNPL